MPSEFKQACLTVERSAKAPGTKPERLTELGRLARKLESLPAGGLGRPPPDIRQVAEDIRGAVARGIVLTRRQVRQGTWCLWNENTRLAEDVALRAKILDQVAMSPNAGPFRTLASNFLEAFRRDEVGIEAASAVLTALAPRWPGNWSRLHRDYRIFDVEAGPKALARAVSEQDRSPDQILQEYGVGLMSARGGYVRAVIGALLDHLAAGGEPNDERRIEKVQRYALTAQGRPLFGDMLGQIAEAILLPFQGRNPGKVLRDLVLSVVLKVFGDPRRRETQPNWRLVPAPLTGLVRSWLAEQSLRQFLDVVDDTANDKYMWRYRRAFWEGVYNSGLVSEAWVAFGPEGERRARREYGKDASFGLVMQDGKHVESGHAVLLLRIGDGVVADWSHNGSCNIWSDANASDAPALYKNRYGSNDLRIPCTGNLVTADRFRVSHTSSDHYNWQGKVAERIREMTGRRLQEKDYALRR